MKSRLRWPVLILLYLLVLAWGVSGTLTYGVASCGTNESTQVLISRGCLIVNHISFPGISPRPWRPTAEISGGFGWNWRSSRITGGMHVESVSLPLWWAELPLAALTFIIWGLRKWRAGRCPTCGYEMGTLAVCPECGKPTPVRTSAAPPR